MTHELAIAVSRVSQAETFFRGQRLFLGKDALSRYLEGMYENPLALTRLGIVSYLYFGNSFCQYRLPSVNEIRDALALCEIHNLQFVLVTPPLNDVGIAQCQTYLDALKEAKQTVPVVVNDLGFLTLLRTHHYPGEIIWGRVLDRTTRDARMTVTERRLYYSASGYNYALSLASTSESYRQILAQWGVTRIQYDCASYPLCGGDFHYDLIYPTEYLTTGRICLFRTATQTGNHQFSIRDGCVRSCQDFMELLERPADRVMLQEDDSRALSLKVVRYGNTLFCLHANLHLPSGIDRVVVDLDLVPNPSFSLKR